MKKNKEKSKMKALTPLLSDGIVAGNIRYGDDELSKNLIGKYWNGKKIIGIESNAIPVLTNATIGILVEDNI